MLYELHFFRQRHHCYSTVISAVELASQQLLSSGGVRSRVRQLQQWNWR
jgi:hypothetical protein